MVSTTAFVIGRMSHLVTSSAFVSIIIMVILAAGVKFLYGGEASEVIQFMDPGTTCEEVSELTPDDMRWLKEVQTLTRRIEALPVVVGAVQFNYDDDDTNNNKVKVTLGCCWKGGRLDRAQDNCDESGAKPTHLEALQGLYKKITEQHMCDDHPHHPKAVEAAAKRRSDVEMVEAATAFDKMKMAASRQQNLVRLAGIHEKAAEVARVTEEKATRAREAAEAMAKKSKAAAAAVQPPTVSHKKQRTAFGSSSSTIAGPAAEEVTEKATEAAAEAADPEAWESYSLAIFRSLARKFTHTSAVPVDPANTDTSLPARGDDDGTRGWRNHKQRGMYAAVRHWANGSPHRVAFMLAELAVYFNVVDQVTLAHLPCTNSSLAVQPHTRDECWTARLAMVGMDGCHPRHVPAFPFWDW